MSQYFVEYMLTVTTPELDGVDFCTLVSMRIP
jgi:hypothetical protein